MRYNVRKGQDYMKQTRENGGIQVRACRKAGFGFPKLKYKEREKCSHPWNLKTN